MPRIFFETESGIRIPAVSEDEMREVDRIAVEEYQLGILQMMENAGRNLASHAMEWLDDPGANITVLAGPGGNGGGGLCCARHLHNRGYAVQIVLTSDTASLRGAAKTQMTILEASGLQAIDTAQAEQALTSSHLIIDAMIGYSLSGPPTGAIERLIPLANKAPSPIFSLDLPSGLHATSGDTPGVSVNAERTLTLALPKTGLRKFRGSLYLADIGIPFELYQPLGLEVPPFPSGVYIQLLRRS